MTQNKLPAAAQWAGYLGVLPFAAACLLAMLGRSETGGIEPEWALSLAEDLALGWGAIILTFIGAVHWGLAVAERWVWTVTSVLGSVLPSVAGLVAMLRGGVQGIALLVVGFGLFWLYEHRVQAEQLPAEYLSLRRTLTLAVCAVLALTAFTLDTGRSL